MFTLFLLLLILTASANPTSTCLRGVVDAPAIKRLVASVTDHHEALLGLAQRLRNPDNTPTIRTIISSDASFNQHFPKYHINVKPSIFFHHEELGFFALLSGSTTIDPDLDKRREQCFFLGGTLFEPAFTHLVYVSEMLKERTSKIRLPLSKVTGKTAPAYIGSKHPVRWIKNVDGFILHDLSTDDKTGIVIDLTSPYSAVVKKADFGSVTETLCKLPTTPLDTAHLETGKLLTEEVQKIVLDNLNMKVSGLTTWKSSDDCFDFSLGLPPSFYTLQTRLNKETQIANTISWMRSRQGLLDILQHSDSLRKAVNDITTFLDMVLALTSTTTSFLPRNDGDWTKMTFEITEAEEQIIATLTTLFLLTFGALATIAVRLLKNHRHSVRRRRIIQRHSNLNEIPLRERAKLLK